MEQRVTASGMDASGWIDASRRAPTEADCDVFGCVLAYHRYNGAQVTGWRQFGMNKLLTHWRPIPKPPAPYKELHAVRPREARLP